ncbi:putative type VI secretion protein [Escherichia coli]|uniref:Putative type VI secretion protein n=1 Tax=Escherichia coli TaxID=562 RepID=A0A447Y458_ECOLX|nr:putative type VI secretion protein [Escherichia coli]
MIVSEVVNVALSGVIIRPVTHVPAAIPLRLEKPVFRAGFKYGCGPGDAGRGALYFLHPGIAGDVKLELFAVLRT